MPVAKYKLDKKSKLYYTYEKTGQYLPNGKPKYQKLRAKSIAALDAKVKEYHANAALGIEPNRMTVDEWQKQWFDAYKANCRETTRNWYACLYGAHVKPAIGMMRLSDVKEIHLRSVLSAMAQTHSIKTVKAVRSVMFSLFKTAAKNNLISGNPAADLDAEGKAGQKKRALTQSERAAYLEACKAHPYGTFAAFIYFFGLRRGEALALRGSDIYPDHISITRQCVYPKGNKPKVEAPKTHAGIREIDIPTKARDYIDFGSFPDGLLFHNELGEMLSYTEQRNRWNSFLSFALGDDTDITEHILRHNYCTMLFEAGADLVTVKTLAGHEDVKTTLSIYTHYSEKLQEQGRRKVLDIG